MCACGKICVCKMVMHVRCMDVNYMHVNWYVQHDIGVCMQSKSKHVRCMH